MRVLHLISSSGMYGAENVVATLARNSETFGLSCWIGIFQNAHQPDNEVGDTMERRGMKVLGIPCGGRWDRETLHAIREIVQAREIQLVHTHGYKADLYGYFATRRQTVPIVATCHGWTRETWAVSVYEFLDRLVLRRFDSVVAVSEAIRDKAHCSGIPCHKISVIDNGVDLTSFSDAEPTLARELNRSEGLLVGTVGRLVEEKGIHHFLAAARLALDRNPKLHFVVVGDGPDKAKLQRLALELGLQNRVTFTGERGDMPQVHASLDIFVLASLKEGLPMAMLEAMASGRPVIATRVGAVPKVLVDEENGMLVEPANEKDLCRALLACAENDELRKQMATNAKACVRARFSSLRMTTDYIKVYQRIEEDPQGTLSEQVADLRA